ncbi:MAG: phosphatase PAP2 family protein [Gaiellaceae bacterium]
MPLILLLIVSAAVGALTFLAARRYPTPAAAPTATLAVAETVGHSVAAHSHRRLHRRLDPVAATGLALTIALVVVIGGGFLLAILAYLVRSNSQLVRLDRSVAKWGNDHAGSLSTHGLNLITNLAGTWTVVALAVVLAAVESWRAWSRWIVPFLAVVLVGEGLLTVAVKDLAHRVRPTFNPLAATLGPSFPSGHSATAAAFYAAAALLIGRRKGPAARSLLAGLAAGIAVAVAASRVLLDVHWVSDVIAGLALGWAWFAVCGIAFGGRLLRFGVAVEAAARAADVPVSPAPGERAPTKA